MFMGFASYPRDRVKYEVSNCHLVERDDEGNKQNGSWGPPGPPAYSRRAVDHTDGLGGVLAPTLKRGMVWLDV